MTRLLTASACLVAMPALLLLPGRWYLLMWLPFAVGARLVLGLHRRTALTLVLLGGAALPLSAALHPPNSSDDMYRYIWDGRVQLTGTDPYRYPPAAPQLAQLRDDFLWPAASNWCVPGGCTLINRPEVPTIYPPVAEAVFAGVTAVTPAGSRERPMQLTMAGFAFGLGAFLWYGLRLLGRDPRRAVLWAWCPLVALEAGNNAHVEVVAVAFTAVAVLVLTRARTGGAAALGGAALGLAVATKLTPALLAPVLARRRPVAVGLGVAGALCAVYLPHVLAVGPGVLGYLPGYLHEEGYADGSRFALLDLVLPDHLVRPVAVVVLATVAVVVLRTVEEDEPWRAGAAMVGAALLVTAPTYPWYAMVLVMLVAYGASTAWFALAVAAYLAQFAPQVGLATHDGQRIGYAVALVAVVVGLLRGRPVMRPRRGQV
ncbi:hypothetical protein GCM10022255_092150 [Dactylosporangium darangshiense]|uniref:DUF2029 domain-containing protein n=1 Tax=Dactylosporangium darangshiense TaxID=579108 RepID=A0ABP8DPJ4_9ACTN